MSDRPPVVKTIADYQAAFEQANGYVPRVTYSKGWYLLHFTGKRVRQKTLIEYTANLLQRVAIRCA